MKYKNHQPDSKQQCTSYFADVKSPGYVRDIVKKNVWQWRVFFHVWNSVVDYHHHESCDPRHYE